MNKPIGVFDSGVGGLTVVKELLKQLPGEDIVYFGDTSRVPYGTKSKPTIIKFSVENANFLATFDIKLLVVACNTSSSLSLDVLKERFKLPIVDVIEPSCREAVKLTQNKKIGVIGTQATVKSNSYQNVIKAINPDVEVFTASCPLFVPLAEEGWVTGEVTEKVAETYLAAIRAKEVDTLILGCTHYPLLADVISKVMGKKVKLVNSARHTAMKVKSTLNENNLLTESPGNGNLKFFVSDEVDNFKRVGKSFLGSELTEVDIVKEGYYVPPKC